MNPRHSLRAASALALGAALAAGCSGTEAGDSMEPFGLGEASGHESPSTPTPQAPGDGPAIAAGPEDLPPSEAIAPSLGAPSPGAPSAGGSDAEVGSGVAGANVPVAAPPDDVLLEPTPSAGDATAAASCGIQDFTREVKPTEVLLVIDRSGSMENELEDGSRRWDAVVPAVVSAIEATTTGILWGVKSYPELDETDSCAPESIVPTIHVPIGPGSTPLVIDEVLATTPLGDGTPTGDAIGFALDHLHERSALSDSPKFILLATDGEPTCPEDDDDISPVGFTVAALTAAREAGFPTFVLGVDTTKEKTIRNLNEMAVAGGRPRPSEPFFYLASSQAEIAEALAAITGAIASCVFDLDPPPPVPDNIAVDFGDARADRDPTRQNGWEYTRDDHTQLEVYGSFCERIRSEAMNQVSIKYGCPDQPIPKAR